MDGATTALNRLRTIAHELGKPGSPDRAYIEKFATQVNEDLNMPRALAVTWDLVKSDLPPQTKKATLCEFDRILGLG
jgi:cysteinyl-tRNA synthetase